MRRAFVRDLVCNAPSLKRVIVDLKTFRMRKAPLGTKDFGRILRA